jgi:hypothetical protein
MNYETKETLADQLEEAREIIQSLETDEAIVLRMVLDVRGMVFHCRDYSEISQALSQIVMMHHPDVVDRAEAMEAVL